MFPRQLVYWVLWAAVIVGVICLIVHKASAIAPPMPPGFKTNHVSVAVHQGSGASALLKPKAAVPPHKPVQQPIVHYAAVTATLNGLESLPSSEIAYTNQSYSIKPITLTWDPETNGISYTLYRGYSPGIYKRRDYAGTNSSITVPAGLVLTNLVVSVLGLPSPLRLTNPTAPFQFWTGHNLTISSEHVQ